MLFNVLTVKEIAKDINDNELYKFSDDFLIRKNNDSSKFKLLSDIFKLDDRERLRTLFILDIATQGKLLADLIKFAIFLENKDIKFEFDLSNKDLESVNKMNFELGIDTILNNNNIDIFITKFKINSIISAISFTDDLNKLYYDITSFLNETSFFNKIISIIINKKAFYERNIFEKFYIDIKNIKSSETGYNGYKLMSFDRGENKYVI